MFERLTRQMAIAEGVTEQLKADNQMAWVIYILRLYTHKIQAAAGS